MYYIVFIGSYYCHNLQGESVMKMNYMNYTDFAKGIGVGMAAGAMVTAAMAMKKRSAKSTAGRLVKTAGKILTDVQDTMGL